MTEEEEDYLATETREFLNPLDTLERWTHVARLLHQSFKGRVDEPAHRHLTKERLRDLLQDARGEELNGRTITRLLTSFAIRIREQEAARSGQEVRATRDRNGKLKHPELPKDIHGGYYLRPDQHPIPVLLLSDQEARTLLFALRYLLHNAVEQQPALISLLAQLAAQFSGVISAVANKTIAQAKDVDGRKPSDHVLYRYEILEHLTRAWLTNEIVHLSYKSPWPRAERGWEPNDFQNGCFQTVLIEPSRANGATYVVGYLVTDGAPQVRTLKVDRIEEVRAHPGKCRRVHPPTVTPEEWEESIPDWLDDLDESWSGVLSGGPSYRFEIRFAGDAATRVRETPWRQHLKVSDRDEGGSRIMTGNVTHYLDMVPWVLGWGAGAEVISPPELRAEVVRRLREAAANYS